MRSVHRIHRGGLLAILATAVPSSVAAAQNPPPRAQNPSPMVETTRAHERLTPTALGGLTRMFDGPLGRPVEMWMPTEVRGTDHVNVVVHFLGAAWLPHYAAAQLRDTSVAVVVNLGAGSGVYHNTFRNAAVFDSLLASVTREVSLVAQKPVSIRRLTLSGFSAGHGAIRVILREPRHFGRVDAVLLLDGMHTSYVPEGLVIDKGGTLDTTNLVAFADYARAAMAGGKRFVVTHSEIFPGTFASTSETADWLLQSVGLRRTAVLRWGPRGMQQLSEARSGGFEVLGFAGNSGPDHSDHFHAMPELLARVNRR